jgi:hypothetical protein
MRKNWEKRIEMAIGYKVVRKISQILHEEFYPPEFMFRKEFIKEVKDALKEVKKGKLLSWKDLQKEWKKEYGKV